ncbi:MAG: carbon-nitrogen hydrolase family protein [Alphaproteobacteria bacterium]|nr:MAG: carbon-nitrogen hydrolase family protein [Alphaproteobacteria bacterium]
MARHCRVGILQMTSSREPAENVATAEALIRRAAAKGAELVATPEMTTIVERSRTRLLAATHSEADDPALPRFRTLAADLGIHLLIGSMPIRVAQDRLANRSFLIAPDGSIAARYDKIHLFDVDLPDGESYRESALYRAGSEAVLVATPLAAIGLSICYDLRFPHLYRLLAGAGAEILFVPSAFTRRTGRAHWHTLLRARAIETGAFVIAPAQVGRHADGRTTFGHALAVSPWGEILLDLEENVGEAVINLDLEAVAEARSRIPALRHDRPIRLQRIEAVADGTRSV